MPTGTIVLLGAFAGLTIFLGLPVARLKNVTPNVKIFLSMVATGVLIFLFFDVVGKASEPINDALATLHDHHTGAGTLFADFALLVLGLGLGLIGLVYFNRHVIGRLPFLSAPPSEGTSASSASLSPAKAPPQLALAGAASGKLGTATAAKPKVVRPAAAPAKAVASGAAAVAANEMTPQALALIIASGIGLHNFSEGLAIGQSAAAGELSLAAVLIVGFGLHNMTEGFGIAGPLTGKTVPWKFIGLLGLIGGGPTFLGTVVGIAFHSPQLFIFCLAFAAGAIIFVVAELLGVAKRARAQEVVMIGLFIGFFLGYLTDMIVTYAGA
jgi:ZIP family zinc transporter